MTVYQEAIAKLEGFNCIGWYRGLSIDQIRACDELLNSIRDDTEQGTEYRVRRNLRLLGVNPLAKPRDLMVVLEISRGNDLAFLYFLWEAYYKSGADACSLGAEVTYTCNEQLLLSAIAHLDMTSTLRELDRILPPVSYSSKFKMATGRQLLQNVEKIPFSCEIEKLSPRKQKLHPYFTKVKPTQYTSFNARCDPPPMRIIFPMYDKYKNGYYKIPNERNRWFANYALEPSKRIVKKILTKVIDCTIFADNMELTEKEQNALCETHQMAKTLESIKAEEIKYQAIQRCMEFWDIPGIEQKARRSRIVKQLEKEIDCCATRLREFSRQMTDVKTLSTANCEYCKQVAFVSPRKKANLSVLMGLDIDNATPHSQGFDSDDFVTAQSIAGEKLQYERCLSGGSARILNMKEQPRPEIEKEKEIEKIRSTKSKKNKRKKQKKKAQTKEKAVMETKRVELGVPYCIDKCQVSPKVAKDTEEPFFKASSLQNLYQFDYQKIFNFDKHENVVENCCINALQCLHEDDLSEVDNITPNPKIVQKSRVERAAEHCANNIFQHRLKVHSIEQLGKQSKLKLHNKPPPCGGVIGLERYFDMKSLNPEDVKVMENLLESAIFEMRKEPRFVLAALPNAHKLPILLDWIQARYKKTYRRDELEKFAQLGQNLYHGLVSRFGNSPPRPDKVFKYTQPASYRKYPNLQHEAKEIRNLYYQKLNRIYLEDSRTFWLAMRGYSCFNAAYKDPYFAYMPSRETDIFHYNVWASDDFRNVNSMRLHE